MVGFNKSILRTILIASYVIIIILIIYGVSALFSYLNTGADRSSILHTEIKKERQYTPKIVWSPLNNEGRSMDSEVLKTLENNYIDAWYVKHLAYKTNTKEGLKDYYTDSARENLHNIIDLNTAEDVTIESTSLEHHPTLNFFSEDGQLAVVTDKDVVEYKRVFKDGKLVIETTEKSTYKIVFLLEDGFWRIRHLVKEHSKNNDVQNIKTTPHLTIKGINYYPQDSPWNMFGDSFSENIISDDFKIIKDAGLNSVRVFIPYKDFGKGKVNEDKLKKLEQILNIAERKDLKVLLTLFDFYGDYSVINWSLNQRHAEAIVNRFKDHKALLGWDIKNEPNLDFESRGKKNVVAWLDHMINLVKSIDKTHPVTIGWSDAKSASILKDDVDFVSFHFYKNINELDTTITNLKLEVSNKPIVMGEFGLSSYSGFWKPFGSSEEDQANYHKKAQEIIAKHKLQYMSWTLYDFNEIPKEVVGRLPWRKNAQKHFGFINSKGTKKVSFKFITKP